MTELVRLERPGGGGEEGGVPFSFTPEGVRKEKGELSDGQKKENISSEMKMQEGVLLNALQRIDKMAQVFGRHLRFEVKRDAGLVQVQVVDTSDGKIVRKIPPDEVVRMVERVHELLGAIFDREA